MVDVIKGFMFLAVSTAAGVFAGKVLFAIAVSIRDGVEDWWMKRKSAKERNDGTSNKKVGVDK